MVSPRYARRDGNVLVLTVFMMVGMMGFLALAVDLGYLCTIDSELRRAADAGAIAATRALIDAQQLAGQTGDVNFADVKATARQFVALNKVNRESPDLAAGDIVEGYLPYPFSPSAPISFDNPNAFNAVTVQVQRTAQQNGGLSLFFAQVLGIGSAEDRKQATAAFVQNISGFRLDSDSNDTLGILPFALDKLTWEGLLAGGGSDQYRYDPDLGSVSLGGDGVREVNLYPQGTGAPGNRGTVDIGSSNNSTCDIARQILHGVNARDLSYMGGKIELDANGVLPLNGDTGISAGVKDELNAIKGQPRMIPIFQSVVGPGNNATYTIVAFVGIRILNVRLTGSASTKQVIIQPARMVSKHVVPSPLNTATSYGVYSGVQLVK